MKVRISKGKARGAVNAPPSKSMAHRLLICAGLSEGTCMVNGIAESEDVLATIDCLEAMGAHCEKMGESIKVTGTDIRKSSAEGILNCRESGSTLRFFIPICLLSGNNAVLAGSERLMKRPVDIYKNICEERKLVFSQDKTTLMLKGPLKAGEFKVAGNVSSQFISGLLFALPLLEQDSTITILPPIESKSYIDMTISALACFGVSAVWKDDNKIYIKGGQKYHAEEVQVEGDYSNAAFFEALNVFGGEVKINGLDESSIQGDKVYARMFEQLKRGIPTLNLSNCPDLAPILFAVAAAENGGVFTGTGRLRIKESDRGSVMAQVLREFGVSAKVHDDEIVIYPIKFKAPEKMLSGFNDHRIVMSEAVLLTLTGGTIDGAEAVTKSFPDFFDKLKILGIKVEKIDDN